MGKSFHKDFLQCHHILFIIVFLRHCKNLRKNCRYGCNERLENQKLLNLRKCVC